MNQKIILIIINTSWNIYNFRLGLINALQQEGYKIIALAPKDDYSNKLEQFDIEFHDIKINNKGTNPIEDIKLIWDFYQFYKKLSPDVILTYTIKPTIYGSIAAKIRNIPTINNISGLGAVFLNDNLSSKIGRLLHKIALYKSDTVFFQNPQDKKLFIDSKFTIEQQAELLPGSGINTEYFKPEKIIKKTVNFTFLCVARLVGNKGIKEYESAAKKLKKQYPKIVFQILGAYYPNNPTALSLEEIAQWKGGEVIDYLGTNDNVRAIMLQADCIVLPSYREGLSHVLLEAASLEKPIITTNVPGCMEVVDEGINGYLCQVKDVDSLVQKMKKIFLLDEEKRNIMGKNGRKKIKAEFDERIVIQKYIAAIDKCLTPSHNPT